MAVSLMETEQGQQQRWRLQPTATVVVKLVESCWPFRLHGQRLDENTGAVHADPSCAATRAGEVATELRCSGWGQLQ